MFKLRATRWVVPSKTRAKNELSGSSHWKRQSCLIQHDDGSNWSLCSRQRGKSTENAYNDGFNGPGTKLTA